MSLAWTVALSIFAHPTTTELNVVGSAMGPFVFGANMFTFVILVSLHILLSVPPCEMKLAAEQAGKLTL
jgi:hypothetical protein